MEHRDPPESIVIRYSDRQRKHGSDRYGTEAPACGNLSLAGMCDRMSLPNRIMVLTSNRSIMPLFAPPANMNDNRLLNGFKPRAGVYAATTYFAYRRGAESCFLCLTIPNNTLSPT